MVQAEEVEGATVAVGVEEGDDEATRVMEVSDYRGRGRGSVSHCGCTDEAFYRHMDIWKKMDQDTPCTTTLPGMWD